MPEEEMQIVMKASDILKKDDFLKSFKAVIELVTKVQKKVLEDYQKSMEMMHSMMNEITEKLKEGNLGNFSSLKKEIFGMKDGMMAEHKRGMGKMYEEYEKMAKEQREGMNFIYDKMRTMKSDNKTVSAPTPALQLTPQQIRDKLETLSGKARLVVEAVEGTHRITISEARPENPQTNDLWIDIS